MNNKKASCEAVMPFALSLQGFIPTQETTD